VGVIINKAQFQRSIPADLAFLAMTQQQLGHAKEAQAELQRLRERMKDPRWAQDAEAQGFLREAEALLAISKTPGSLSMSFGTVTLSVTTGGVSKTTELPRIRSSVAPPAGLSRL